MRILQMVKGIDIGGENGGSEKFGLELALALARMGEAVSLCAFYRHGTALEASWAARLEQAGVSVFYAVDNGQSLPGGFNAVAQRCKGNRIQVIHSHFQVGSLAAIYSKWSGACRHIIRTAHITKEWGDGLVAWLSRQVFGGIVFPLAFDAEFGVSQAIMGQLNRRLASRLLRRRAGCIYNALPEMFTEGMEERVQARWSSLPPAGRMRIGSVGRLTPRKGFADMLKALAILKPELPDLHCVLIGDGEQRLALEAQAARLGLGEVLEFAGQVADIPDRLGKLDLFVLPSLQEGLPTVILESMACGTPVVTTDIPGTRELVQDGLNGWLVPARHPHALAKAIHTALSDPVTRQKMALEGVKQAQRFTIQASAAQYMKLYHNLATQGM